MSKFFFSMWALKTSESGNTTFVVPSVIVCTHVCHVQGREREELINSFIYCIEICKALLLELNVIYMRK